MTAGARDVVIVDTGPLVLLYSDNGLGREECLAVARQVAVPMLTSWAVVTEAAWMLRARPEAVLQMLADIAKGGLRIPPLEDADIVSIGKILDRYRDMRPQLADATLVHLAEREKIDTIFTLDRRDFSVYRTTRRRAFRIVPAA